MATLQAQVEGLTSLSVGTTPTTAELAEFLKDGVIDVTNRWLAMKPQDVEDFVRGSSTQSSNGFATSGANIVSVIREAGADGDTDGSTAWEPCRKVPSSMRSRVVDVDSLSYASKYNPVYIINNNSAVNVYPVPDGTNDGYRVYYVNNEPKGDGIVDELAAGHSTIGYFPKDKVYLVVIYASMKSLQAKMADTTITDLSVTAVPPDVPTIATVSYTAATEVDIASVSDMSVSDIVAVTNASVSSITGASSNQPTYIPPVVPDALSLGAIGTVSDVSPLGRMEDYVSTEEDTELSNAMGTVINSQINEYTQELSTYQAELSDSVNAFNKENSIYSQLVQQDAQNANATNQANLQNMKKDLQINQANMQKNLQASQSNMQKELTRAQADAQSDSARLLQDAIQTVQAIIANNASLIQKWTQELTQYQSEVATEVQEYTQNLQADGMGYQWLQGQYTALKVEYDAAFMIAAPKQQPQQQVRG